MMQADPPFYLVWRDGGNVPRFQHATLSKAEAEAERLAMSNPGETFYVLIPSCRFAEKRVVCERFDINADEIPF